MKIKATLLSAILVLSSGKAVCAETNGNGLFWLVSGVCLTGSYLANKSAKAAYQRSNGIRPYEHWQDPISGSWGLNPASNDMIRSQERLNSKGLKLQTLSKALLALGAGTGIAPFFFKNVAVSSGDYGEPVVNVAKEIKF
jgi:hypothetical protein